MFLLLITFRIINFKMIRDVFVLRKCYQCGGELETLVGPVVKHSSVRDSTITVYGFQNDREFQNAIF